MSDEMPDDASSRFHVAGRTAPDRPATTDVRTGDEDALLWWLLTSTRNEDLLTGLLSAFCRQVRSHGIPIVRTVVQLHTHHPQWLGTRLVWRPELGIADATPIEYGVMQTAKYLNSPVAALHEGAEWVRARLDLPPVPDEYPLCAGLRREGMTDYVAWPLLFTLDRRHTVTYATDRPGGFTEADLCRLARLLPALALVVEVRFKNELARRLLDTYVGPHAGEQILNGATTRGSGHTITAVVAIYDLRGFTIISDRWPRDDVIELLNVYFDVVSGPIEGHGGEILKFMGDGLLAIFPLSRPDAVVNALQAVDGARRGMADLNRRRTQQGQEPLGFGVGVNVGEVMYGNIGTSSRLDFTVIGPVVNAAARLEALTKVLGVTTLVSKAFAQEVDPTLLTSMGAHRLRGFGERIEVFAFPDEAASRSGSETT